MQKGGLSGSSAAVVEALYQLGHATRAELVAATGLSRATVSGVLAGLTTRGLVIEQHGPAGRGRPPGVLVLDPRTGLGVGVDIGARHVAVAVGDRSGAVYAERRWEVPVGHRPEEVVGVVAHGVDEVLAAVGATRATVAGAGVSLAAPVRSSNGTIADHGALPGWTSDRLAAAIGMRAVVDNDATLGAWGELTRGRRPGLDTMRSTGDLVYVKWSSRVGAGLVVRGAPYRGADGYAGEVGHLCLDPDGPLCWCGSRGCVEAYAGGEAMLARAPGLVPDGRDRLDQLVDLALAGDRVARETILTGTRALGRGLAGVVSVTNPGRIVLGGRLARAAGLVLGQLTEEVRRWSSVARMSGVRVEASMLGDRAALLGALALALSRPASRAA